MQPQNNVNINQQHIYVNTSSITRIVLVYQQDQRSGPIDVLPVALLLAAFASVGAVVMPAAVVVVIVVAVVGIVTLIVIVLILEPALLCHDASMHAIDA